MKIGSKNFRLILFAAAAVAAWAAALLTGQFSSPNHWEYSTIARNILSGRGFVFDYLGTEYRFYGPALYPFFMAAVLKITGGSETAILLIQGLLFAATALLVYRIALLLFGRRAALAAFGLAALHPGNLVYAGRLHSQTLDIFLIVLSFYLILRLKRETSLLKGFGTGLVTGLAVLCRATFGPFLLLWGLWFTFSGQQKLRRFLLAAVVAAGCAAVFVPVLARGYLVYGHFVPLRSDTGVNLWYGNHPGASGTSYTLSAEPAPVLTELPAHLSSRIGKMNEFEQNREFLAAAGEFMAKHPREEAALFARKFVYFWSFSPHTGLLYPSRWLKGYGAYYLMVLLSALIGFAAAAAGGRLAPRRGGMLFLLAAAAVSVTQAAFYIEGRHRWQIEPLLLVFAGGGLSQLFGWITLKNRTRVANE